jgi:hypothetical protein
MIRTWLMGAMTVISTAAVADDAVMRGAGAFSCAQFRAEYKKNPKMADLNWGTWAQGFMSRMNAQLVREHKPGKTLPDVASTYRAIRQRCDGHPLSAFWVIVFDYFEEFHDMPTSK